MSADTQTPAADGDRRSVLARRYESRTITASQGSTWKAGEDGVPGVCGWIVAIVAEAGAGSELRGKLVLRYPMKGTSGYRVDDFFVTRGGQFYVPWPFVELSVQDASGGAGTSRLTVGFFPVSFDDLPPPGVDTAVYGATLKTINAGVSADFTVPNGATGYRAMPSTGAGPYKVEEKGSVFGGAAATWSAYSIDPTLLIRPGTETGGGSWRATPPSPGAKITVTNGAGAAGNFAVFWEYGLGGAR